MIRAGLLSTIALAAAGCYGPAIPNGAQQCAPGGACADGYQCGADNRCYRIGQLPGDGGARDLAIAGDLAGADLARSGGADLAGPDLAGADRAGVDLAAVDLATVDLAVADMARAPDLVAACASDAQCGGAAPRCDLTTHLCVACLPMSDNCPLGAFCAMSNGVWACVDGCKSNADCTGAAKTCCANVCVDTTSDGANCGGCNVTCGAQTCCSSTCVNINSDVSNCGQCGRACSGGNANWSCTNKTCAIASCKAPFLDCDAMSGDGCEVNDSNDPNHCGACGTVCSSNHVVPQCVGGVCGGACANGFADCNGNKQADGCEVNLLNDPNHCGNCTTRCATCVNGICQVVLYGNPNPFGANSSHSPGFLLGSPLTVAAAGSLVKFGVISRGAGPNVVMALYTDNGGNPGNLVASTPSFALTNSTQEVPVGPIPIAAGTYWILAVYDAAASVGFDNVTPNTQVRYISFTLGNPLPNPFPAPMSYTGQQFNYYIGVQ